VTGSARRSEIVTQHIDAENRHDPDGVVANLHQPNYDIPTFGDAGQVNGAEAVRELWQGMIAAPAPRPTRCRRPTRS
jgi:hypothetical protein